MAKNSQFWNFIAEHVPKEAICLKESFPKLNVCSFAEDDFTGKKWKTHFGTKSRKRLTKTRRHLKWNDKANAFTFHLLMEYLAHEVPGEVVDMIIQFANHLDLGRPSFQKGDIVSYGLKHDFKKGRVIAIEQQIHRAVCVLFDDGEKLWIREGDHELQHRIFDPQFHIGDVVRWVNESHGMEWTGTICSSIYGPEKQSWTHCIQNFYQVRLECEGLTSAIKADFDSYTFDEIKISRINIIDKRIRAGLSFDQASARHFPACETVVSRLTRYRRRMRFLDPFWSVKVRKLCEKTWGQHAHAIYTEYSSHNIPLACDLSNIPKNSLVFVHHQEPGSTELQKTDILLNPRWDWSTWFVNGFAFRGKEEIGLM